MNFIPLDQLTTDVAELYETGLPAGQSTGWPSLDKLYTVAMNQWTLVTGVPHSGKSEWLDALMVNLASAERWRFCIFSPENHPLAMHCAKILEKKVGKPFGKGPTERMTPEERDEGMKWIRRHFAFMQSDAPDLASILAASATESSLGKNFKLGVVVDPWNQIEHRHPKDVTLTQYVSEQLSWIINFTRNNYAHFWLVAHPKKPPPDRIGKPPTPYEIADSAHFYNKGDNIICVHRNQLEDNQNVQIHAQKIRFKNIGHIGMVELAYDRVTGRYHIPMVDHSIAHYYEPREK
jgi:twinkle protein